MTELKAYNKIGNVRMCLKVTSGIFFVLGVFDTVNSLLIVTAGEEGTKPW